MAVDDDDEDEEELAADDDTRLLLAVGRANELTLDARRAPELSDEMDARGLATPRGVVDADPGRLLPGCATSSQNRTVSQ